MSVTNACSLTQVITQNTRVCTNSAGKMTSTCTDHIFTNAAGLCSKGDSVPIGCSDHNIVAIARKTKVVYSIVYEEKNPDGALNTFEKVFYEIINKHAKVKKFRAPWIDQGLKEW